MEPFFQFLGGYWWLIFPLMGVAGGVGRAWQKALDRRHRRRLEILKAKSELKAAQAAVRATTQPIAIRGKGGVESQATRLQRLMDTHDEVTQRWLAYELDVAKLIAFPAMSDGRQPLTAAFLRARKVADHLRPASARVKIDAALLAEYREAVNDYEVAFDVAEKDARRLRDSTFSEAERRRLDTAKQLLSVAIDEAATPAERQLAYRRVRQELDGLISLSDEAVEVLEKKVALEITTGASPVADANPGSTPVAAPPPRPPAASAPSAPSGPSAGTWPVPARSAQTAPGRVVRPKPPATPPATP
ncbi:MAG TPA: hypothetical protein VNT50_10150 [Microbacterium sp.]|uniref:hypothetical protein n=1 Tax=Microbacterium sp. TaxID=51671 RepID=UPI002C2BDC94|nr:hypothetical protein [Microbacterium sp.]HWI31843.1 hypothetical protein [Microbacterium sp.]